MLATAVAVPAGTLALGATPAAAATGRSGDPLRPKPIPKQRPATEGFLEVPGGVLWYWDTGGRGTAVEHAGSGRHPTERSRPAGRPPVPKLAHRITWDLLESIRVRTLLTAGGADLYMPPPVTRTLLEHLPNASLLTFSASGHSPHWEQPGVFNRKLLQFLAGARFPEGARC